ncbi:MAG: DSD1 family PLP-dependent enzyme [Planctomycetia bacterium]|nr:DSD1 family PLP-dependent enzyme [Planctomycetia bacterium]
MLVNRRRFLTTALAANAVRPLTVSGAEAQLPATIADLPTPALLVDLVAFEANLKKMAEHCQQTNRGHRPHAKTHKCPEIARRQVAAGALGVCVATVPEAEAMVAAGLSGVLLTSPIVEVGKIKRLVELARKPGAVMLSVGHVREAELLVQAPQSAEVHLDVLIDVDVGDRRTGSLPGEPAVELARLLGQGKYLHVRGVQAYSGKSSHTVGFEERRKTSQAAWQQALETRDRLTRAGFEMKYVSGGSTGTYNIDSAIAGITELQVGSYVFMDVDYRRIGGQGGAVYTDFQPSLTVLTTVVSAAHPERVTVDAGNKAFATDVASKPEARHWTGLTYNRGGDEFGILTVEPDGKLPKIGDRLEFLTPHCDPTVNLYHRIYAVRGEKVEAAWPIVARRG